MLQRSAIALGALTLGWTGAGCEEESCGKLSACDIRDVDCQARIMHEVVCLRGGSGTRLPAVSVVDEGALLARYMSTAAENAEEQAQRELNYQRWNRGLSLFKLAPPERDTATSLAERAAHVAASYFSETKEILVVDRGGSLASADAVELFAHEMVHALQDSELDLRTFGDAIATDQDSALALAAIVEGEAVHYQLLVGLMLAGQSPDAVDWQAFYSRWQSETLQEAEEDAAPVSMAGTRFPYAFGGALVTKAWLEHGRVGIDALFEAPPRTTQEVMFRPAGPDWAAERQILRDRGVPVLAGGFQATAWTALGAWVTRMFAARMGLDPFTRLDPSRSLAYDLFSVHADQSGGAIVATWRVRTLAGFDPRRWPGMHVLGIEGWTDDALREAFLIAGQPAVPEAARSLTWRSPEAAEAFDGDGSAAGSWPPDILPRGSGIGCVLARPHLRELIHGDR